MCFECVLNAVVPQIYNAFGVTQSNVLPRKICAQARSRMHIYTTHILFTDPAIETVFYTKFIVKKKWTFLFEHCCRLLSQSSSSSSLQVCRLRSFDLNKRLFHKTNCIVKWQQKPCKISIYEPTTASDDFSTI